ncbi:MAG: hypothetical protein FJX55_01285 [Alphaproteobacteria bacterium]|nr:hypothetical protein [Alphaproteobacteria bacterium]
MSCLVWGPALADAIDGDWCAPDGRHLTIDGARVTTPAGRRLEGIYSRHNFEYVVPAPEPASGQTVFMVLRNETTVHLRLGADRAAVAQLPPQIWRRCERPTS